MPGLPHRNPPFAARKLVIESHEPAVRLCKRRHNRDFIVIPGGVQITAVRFRHREQNSVCALHMFVIESERAAEIGARYLHPDEVVGMIGNPHLIGLGITDADCGGVLWHGLRLYRNRVTA